MSPAPAIFLFLGLSIAAAVVVDTKQRYDWGGWLTEEGRHTVLSSAVAMLLCAAFAIGCATLLVLMATGRL
jgi:hypothetical protein